MIFREPTIDEAESCGKIIFEAFSFIADMHRFLTDFKDVESGISLAKFLIGQKNIYGMAAIENSDIIGVGFLDERDNIKAIGPIAVSPKCQNKGVGRALMKILLERQHNPSSVRLVQDSFNILSLSLYSSLGFKLRSPLILLQYVALDKNVLNEDIDSGFVSRKLTVNDLEVCDKLYKQCIGYSRKHELLNLLECGGAYGTFRDEELIAYVASIDSWKKNHGVALCKEDLKILIKQIILLNAGGNLGILLPANEYELFTWCLQIGFRVIKMMNLMTNDGYETPVISYFPSVHY